MLGEDIEQRRQGGITEFSAYRFRRSRIVHIEPNPDTATEKSRYSPFLIAPDLRLADRRGAAASSRAGPHATPHLHPKAVLWH